MTSPFENTRVEHEDRGQTGFDFLVGMSTFLITLGLVFAFVPGMFQPFDTDTGSNMVVADRTASLLAEDYLVDDVTEPGVLNATCTTEFFDADDVVGDCKFDDDAGDLHSALHLDEFIDVNVTIESEKAIVHTAGEAPPATSAVVVSKRVVLLDGEHRTLSVKVW